MIKEVDEQYWSNNVSSSKKSLFFEVDFLEGVAESFSYNLHYFVFENKNKVLMAAALYSDGNNIVTCLPYTYSSIYFGDGLSDRKYLLITNDFIRFLKLKWQKISLRLPVEIKDIRPFIWGGFKISNRYTYLKETETSFPKKVVKNAEKATTDGMTLKVINAEDIDLKTCIKSFAKQGFDKRIVQSNLEMLASLTEQNQLLAFRADTNEGCVCTSLMLVDAMQKKAYALLISESLNEFAHVYINYERCKWCIKNGISQIDFCGANEPGIANFKSSFNGVLTSYSIVHYNPKYAFFNKRIQSLREIAKLIISRKFVF